MDRKKALAQSWDVNAANWARAVREGRIASRTAVTDGAILEAIHARRPKRLLDLGCGEGWLLRRLRERHECEALGLDGSAALIDAARNADPQGRYEVASYDDLVAGRLSLGAPFDAIALNFALFDEEVTPLLSALKRHLAPGGVVVIQTLHPDALAPDQGSGEGWREESFATFEGEAWQPMPWFFRSRESWEQAIATAGLAVRELREPAAPDGTRLSLLTICEAEER
ncbi:MAG: class I SAM-dependent methyltransferase [Kiloniellales bacterium]